MNEAPSLVPFKVDTCDDGLEAFKGWLPASNDSGIEDEDTGRVKLETLRQLIRMILETSVVHRSMSPGKKYIGRAFKGKSTNDRERIIQQVTQNNISTQKDYDDARLSAVAATRDRIVKKKKKAETTRKKKKKRKKCDDLHGKCMGHWYAGGISMTPMIGESDDDASS